MTTAKTERMSAERRKGVRVWMEREWPTLYLQMGRELLNNLESAYRELDALIEAARPFKEAWDSALLEKVFGIDTLALGVTKEQWQRFAALIPPAAPEKLDIFQEEYRSYCGRGGA